MIAQYPNRIGFFLRRPFLVYWGTEGLIGDSGESGAAEGLLATETWGWLEVTELSVELCSTMYYQK